VNAKKRKTPRALVLVAAVAGCAQLPAIAFVSDGGGLGTGAPMGDANVPDVHAAGAEDASNGSDGPVDQPTDDAAGTIATIKCGSSFVSTCAACVGAPLRCKKGTRDECVASCVGCAAGWFPCLHCATATSPPRGSCIPVNANGQIACARTNLCPCDADTDCPAVVGSAETCGVEGAKKGCLTCGAPTTSGAACVSGGGAGGSCQITDGEAPRCN
jgi:hypothetical protein